MDHIVAVVKEHTFLLIVIGVYSNICGILGYFIINNIRKEKFNVKIKRLIIKIRFIINMRIKRFLFKRNIKIDDKEIEWEPFPIVEWYTWGGVKVEEIKGSNNRVRINEKVELGGYVNHEIYTGIKGKKLKIEIENTNKSIFESGEMLKVTYNRDDKCLMPKNIPYLIAGEYIPYGDTVAIYDIPEEFDGKLGFIFYMSTLSGLTITTHCSK